VHKIQPIHVARSVVCISVCLWVGHTWVLMMMMMMMMSSPHYVHFCPSVRS